MQTRGREIGLRDVLIFSLFFLRKNICLTTNDCGVYAMTKEELTNGLNEALESMTDEDYDSALIDAYLAALDRKLDTSSVQRAIAPKTSTPAACATTIPPIRQITIRAATSPTRQTDCALRLGLTAASFLAGKVWSSLFLKLAKEVSVFYAGITT